jgi:putative glutamine amidotransferase
MPLTIGITNCDEWTNYQRWFKSFDPSMVIVRLKKGVILPEQAKLCDGIVLSGGEDVDPSYYNKPEYIEQFGLKDINKERDEYEFEILK